MEMYKGEWEEVGENEEYGVSWKPRKESINKAVVFRSDLFLQVQVREAQNIFSVRNMAVMQKHILVVK